MAVAGMLALSSCSNDDNDQTTQNTPRQMTFTASFGDDAVTRATLSGNAVSFDADDKISILSENNTNTEFTTTSGGASATFSGTATDDTKFYAVYPYTSGLNLVGDKITGVVIPTNQLCADWAIGESGWDPSAPIAYATTTGSSLTFHNLCAILKIQMTDDNAEKCSMTISADQVLAGTFSLDTTDGSLTATSGSTTVTAGIQYSEYTIYMNNNYI